MDTGYNKSISVDAAICDTWLAPTPVPVAKKVLCQNCGRREGTEIWSEGSIAYVHGIFTMWCKRCTVEKQLAFAQEAAARIPDLQHQLMVLDMSGQS
jgi:hypothetical protein